MSSIFGVQTLVTIHQSACEGKSNQLLGNLHQESQLWPRRPSGDHLNFCGAKGGSCLGIKTPDDVLSGKLSSTGEGSSSCIDKIDLVSMSPCIGKLILLDDSISAL